MHAPASLPKLYTVAEALLLWPEGARPTAKRFKALARQLGACRICGRSMTFTDCDLATIVEAMRCSGSSANRTAHIGISAVASRGIPSMKARERLIAAKPSLSPQEGSGNL
jgi:hypothetical protein